MTSGVVTPRRAARKARFQAPVRFNPAPPPIEGKTTAEGNNGGS
ncbi:hypothetical protein ACWGNM_30865 [Streptomyces sp. NPDC055796]